MYSHRVALHPDVPWTPPVVDVEPGEGHPEPGEEEGAEHPDPASIPKDLRAAMLEVMLAMKATIVVTEVSMMARPTLLIALCTACSEKPPSAFLLVPV